MFMPEGASGGVRVVLVVDVVRPEGPMAPNPVLAWALAVVEELLPMGPEPAREVELGFSSRASTTAGSTLSLAAFTWALNQR
jgi:hypothetical protein